MTKAILLTLIAVALALLTGCGGKAGEKETPKAQTPSVVSTSNTSNSAPTVSRNDGDADDAIPANRIVSNTSNANSGVKRSDSDDSRSANKPRASNRPNNRSDADDRGKKDLDGDNDDR